MRIERAVAQRVRRPLHAVIRSMIVLTVTAILVSTRSFSQAARATSQIKKPLIYQIGTVVHINAEGPRPLLLALDALQEKYGWIVDYEDPRFPADSDQAANSPSLPPRRHANVRNLEREGFSVEFDVGPTPDSRPDEDAVLAAVVDAYNQSNSVAQFELRQEKGKGQDGRFDVVGVDVREQHDEARSAEPILDLPITLVKEARSVEQTITLICRKVSKQSKIPVTVNAIGVNVSVGKMIAIGGIGVPARSLLASALASMGARLSWRLLYDASGKSYELNVSGLSQ